MLVSGRVTKLKQKNILGKVVFQAAFSSVAYKVGPLPVRSRVITPLIGVKKNPGKLIHIYLFIRPFIYRGPIHNSIKKRLARGPNPSSCEVADALIRDSVGGPESGSK